MSAEQPNRPVTADAPGLNAVRPATILNMLRSAPHEQRPVLLIRFIEDQLLESLGWEPSQRAQLSAGFAAVGVDSLTSLDLQFRLQNALEFALPLGEALDQGSATELAEALLHRHLALDVA